MFCCCDKRQLPIPQHNSHIIVAQKPFTTDKPVTAPQLEEMRSDFWFTRVEGAKESWDLLKAVVDSVMIGEMETANAMLEAGGMILPLGDLREVYDSTGKKYEIPLYVLYEPSNLVR